MVLQNDGSNALFAGEKEWSIAELELLGFGNDGDRRLVEAVLKFTRLLLEHCGNRSIYASSPHLDSLLNTTSLTVLVATLEVGSELAQRYQASMKRMGNASRQVSAALLANHYNIELDRVQLIAQGFVKTPIVTLMDSNPLATPASTSKGKDKEKGDAKEPSTTHANDLVLLATADDQSWSSWGDVKVSYYPLETTRKTEKPLELGNSSTPTTPTPLRRSNTIPSTQNTPKNRSTAPDDSSPIWPKTPGVAEDNNSSGLRAFELPQAIVVGNPIHELVGRCPDDMPTASKYEVFHRLRVAKALTGSLADRQQIMASRLLAITNLAYIHPEAAFVEKVLRQDMDEARRNQLVYQLADLIHPPSEPKTEVPMWIQTISLALLEAISSFHAKCQDVLSALNANVNHGILLYVIRKAVAGMEKDQPEDTTEKITEVDDWRNNLFSLTLNICMATRVGSEMASAGLMEILVHILQIRSKIAQRHHSMVLAFLDGLIWAYPNAFTAFFNAEGLPAVSTLVMDAVAEAKAELVAGNGITADQQSSAVDYEVPYYQQQTLKWLLKFIHRILSNAYTYGGNTDRLLRNLAENSDLLASLRDILEAKNSFGSVVWTNCVMIMSDFINNDPTSFAAIAESGMVKSYFEVITGRTMPEIAADVTRADDDEDGQSLDSPALSAFLDQDPRQHPPTEESIREEQRTMPLAMGVLPSSDVINVIPHVLNSLCLNRQGMRQVVASRSLEIFLEVFESAEHVKCMEYDSELAQTLGGSFDELARHHPPLRTTISNAVLDMVARVRYMAIQKAETSAWGAALLATTESGDVVPIASDGSVRIVDVPVSSSDEDVSMSDQVSRNSSGDKPDEAAKHSPSESIIPYLNAVASFLISYFSNTLLRAHFVEKGGLELILDMCESPSLPVSYGESMASRVMSQVVAVLIDHAPVLGMPSLLRRAQAAVDILEPLATKTEAIPPYFGPFLAAGKIIDPTSLPEELQTGTKMVKAMLNAQTFIKITSECFPSSRTSFQFYPVNVFEYFLGLVQSLGPLLRGVLAEEAGQLSAVPQHWSIRRRDAAPDGEPKDTPAIPEADGATLPDVINGSGTWKSPDGSPSANRPTEDEQRTARYRNYETLRVLLHPMIPTSFPFFQTLGKALLPRSNSGNADPYVRSRHLEIAKALANTILDHLKPSVAKEQPSAKEFHYWIIMLHTIHEMMIDHPNVRQSDQSNVQILMPVLLAFKEQEGLQLLNTMVTKFVSAIREGSAGLADETSKPKVAAFGLRKVLDLYMILANGKYIVEGGNRYGLQRSTERSQTVPNIFQQINVEIRVAMMPMLQELWTTSFVDQVPSATAKRLLDLLRLVYAADHEPATTPLDKQPFLLLKYAEAKYNWRVVRGSVQDVVSAGYGEDLAREAIFRANGNNATARDYCRAHTEGTAGARNPVPLVDAYAPTPSRASIDADRMSLDTSADSTGEVAEVAETSAATVPDAESAKKSTFPGTKQQLDELRNTMRENLIDQCLDVVRAHPESAIEVSDLIHMAVLHDKKTEAQEEVGSTLTFAISSLALDDEEKAKNGKVIAAYAHLLALLLQDEKFFQANVDSLREKAEEYVQFLKITPTSTGDALPGWIPHILLILELLLAQDERPIPPQWDEPKSLEDECTDPVIQLGTPLVDDQQRTDMLDSLLDMLPRIGKEELLATAVLRVLVILTRRRRLAKHVGEKKNLQRLFLMAKQLSGFGSERLKQNRLTSYIVIILRHIIEDEETIKQGMRAEILADFPNLSRNSRGSPDVASYLRTMAPVALRAPELFVQVTNELIQFSRWFGSNDGHHKYSPLALKEVATADKPAVEHAKSDLSNSQNVKPSTEAPDKEMLDMPKHGQESKRPVVENPDGVIHFLLCELVNYREVEDKEVPTPPKDDASQAPEEPAAAGAEAEPKDKKPSKPQFKAEDHPIFVYRCFLLNCLAELVQGYTRAKIEFINFKRSAPPLSSGTPIKPRSGILNYLIYDLLCQGNLSGTADTIVAKKKIATSVQTQKLLVALVTKTSEPELEPKPAKFVYDEDQDLLYVRKFILDTVLRAYEKAPVSDEPFETRYSRMQCLAELMHQMIGERDARLGPGARNSDKAQYHSQTQLRRLMFEKGYLDKLTSSIADINLNYPGVKRAIKYILRVLRILTETAKELSHSNLLPSGSQSDFSDDEFESSSSLSDLDPDREDTPDLYRNSALGMLEPRDEDEDSDEDEDGDEDMYGGEYGDEYGDEMDYGEEGMSDGDEDISDDDEELGDMGHIEGLHGEPGVVEVIMDEDDDDDEDDDSDDDDDDDDSEDMEDIDDMENRVEIIDEDGNPVEDDSAWESDPDEDEDDEHGHDDLHFEPVEEELEDAGAEHAHAHGMNPQDIFDNMARAIMGGDHELALDEHYLDEDHDEGEDEEEDLEEDDYLDEDDYPPAPVTGGHSMSGWDMDAEDDRQRRLFLLNGNDGRPSFPRAGFPPRFTAERDPSEFRNYFARSHRSAGPNATPDDGVNPLLRRTDAAPDTGSRANNTNPANFGFRLPEGLFSGPGGRQIMDGPMGFLGELMEFLPMMGRGANGQQAFHVHITGPGGTRGAEIPIRPPREHRREATQEPHQAVAFAPEDTLDRYQEEAKLMFGAGVVTEAVKLGPTITALLTPDAMVRERKFKAAEAESRRIIEETAKKQEEERKARQEKEEAERQEQARLAEERAAQEREAAAAAAAEAENEAEAEGAGDASSVMEGVQTDEQAVEGAAAEPAARVTTTIRGEEVDITELGIDPEYLAALPEEFREEVIAQTISERRSQAREEAATGTGEQTEVFQEFLDALPEELRQEIADQERDERRRRNREENRRQAPPGPNPTTGISADMDTASILLTFPSELRQQVLLEQGDALMDQLTPDMAAQARALSHRTPPNQRGGAVSALAGVLGVTQAGQDKDADGKAQRKTVVQMLDKAGVATLLRLMFIAQQGSIRNHLFGVFADVCENRQNRLEVISTVLQILQEGTTDMTAVERSFGHLSIKARRNRDKDLEHRTPQGLKRTLSALTVPGASQSNSETSPILIVQQCLDLLGDLCTRNPHVPWLFLTEHEIVGAAIRKIMNRKGKTKDPKASKYAINALLTLLDRELVTESSVVMSHLADLLNRVTLPLQNLEKKRRESKDVIKPETTSDNAAAEASAAATEGAASADATSGESSKPEPKQETSQRRMRQLQPPVIPDENLMLVVRIFVARECSSKTFQNTIVTIKNLCAIPGTKTVFGKELIRQARLLSENIVKDLDELLPHITEATSGTDVQGVALSKFSPGGSEQNKLLRVLTALDHIFDGKKKSGEEPKGEPVRDEEREELLTSLYHNNTFSAMWEKLGACLSAIRQRENMLNIATILLPLIESLMVVCKNTTTKDDLTQSQVGSLGSPQPESQTAQLFFTFTEEHRRILNELVRHSPKLMSGTFSLLVKNPKVLEFDNKRNFFNRSVHSRSGQNQARQSYPPLQISVRRDLVFHDSFRALYFKSGDEMKFGKLNIRFQGEEGVDAGGVTREWFQVLARQMFDPNYVLFIPVSSDRTTFHPNKLSGVNDEHLMFFKFIGRIIGKALYEGRLLDCFFSRAVYKRILGRSVSVKDMESFDPDYYKSLCWMRDNDITDIITETFSVEDEEFGVAKVVDLIPNGRDIPVTEDNKQEYIRLVVDYKLITSIKEQMEQFLKGFHEIIPAEVISIFNEQELELLISGLPDIDLDDWRGHTEYHGYTQSSPQIQWFWRAIRSFDKEELAKLLQFVTGTSKVPLNGFKELEGMNGVNRFNIHRDPGNHDRLPTSHTCFNRKFLPALSRIASSNC